MSKLSLDLSSVTTGITVTVYLTPKLSIWAMSIGTAPALKEIRYPPLSSVTPRAVLCLLHLIVALSPLFW